ncbi:prepilin-type N-terminal cleavage/methylation domain-containing protein [Geosporobacter ferrireducens]|uniref:Prepilin-type N-terminal cleavage/methylation domain-containing protein n=1 Tax=Geosporobacter ferrireducens TaxID=1424294 RepID=A0A1D8GBA2_9FIRM|nr:prepilin-type N-terminal cleavage/methylation domain-containing protein [Geosporobacter ferrireducens]AOT68180.1 hypothetical protein Gferi_00425 [Geosporobacter ferrireducens]
MKYFNNSKGLTLVELIISIAIVGIIAVAFLGIFTSGITGIISGGNLTKAGYVAQQAMENQIEGLAISSTAVTASTNPPIPSLPPVAVTLNFTGVAVPITVNGKVEQIEYDDGRYRINIGTFIPNP